MVFCRSLELEEWDLGDPQGCLEECQALSGCEVRIIFVLHILCKTTFIDFLAQYFTFFDDQERCFGLANCAVFIPGTCDGETCFSGSSDCQGAKKANTEM